MKRKINKTIPLTRASKNIGIKKEKKRKENPGINLTKDEQHLYAENDKILLRKRNLNIKIEINEKIYHACG